MPLLEKLIKVDYISLVNLIMDKEVVKELIQKELTPEQIKKELLPLKSEESEARRTLLASYDELENLLGGGGASDKIASLLIGNTQ